MAHRSVLRSPQSLGASTDRADALVRHLALERYLSCL